jgi:ApbE superfamily uncharacterized protein (UPF0280 family)
MKTNRYQPRFYRDWVKQGDLLPTHIIEKETDLLILTDKPVDKELIRQRLYTYRWDIENYIARDRRFLSALKPMPVEINAPAIIRVMSAAALKAGVGPMAAVAGAVAESIGRDLLKKKCRDVIIENGGDIFLKTTKPRAIGIYAGRSRLWNNISLKIKPKDTPLGICTSSGTIGHSLSFGSADSVVILSKSASLADAVATAVCNAVKSKHDLQAALDLARSVCGVLGVVIILKKDLISWGGIEFAR